MIWRALLLLVPSMVAAQGFSGRPTGGGGEVSPATPATPGIVQLAGDLSGAASAPTVPGLVSKADVGHAHAEYAATGHAHAGYATSSHAHAEYAASSHAHAEYAATSHGHDASAFVSGVLPAARGGVGVALPACSGTDKLTANGTQVSCTTDQTSAAPVYKVAATVTNSTVTPATVVSWSAAATTVYGFSCVIVHQGTATSGPRFNLNGPASPTLVTIRYHRATSATADTISTSTAFSAAAQTAAITTSGVTTVLVSEIWGNVVTGAAGGTVALQLTSSTAGQTVSVFAGSYCEVK